jgi:hypothetical protein
MKGLILDFFGLLILHFIKDIGWKGGYWIFIDVESLTLLKISAGRIDIGFLWLAHLEQIWRGSAIWEVNTTQTMSYSSLGKYGEHIISPHCMPSYKNHKIQKESTKNHNTAINDFVPPKKHIKLYTKQRNNILGWK